MTSKLYPKPLGAGGVNEVVPLALIDLLSVLLPLLNGEGYVRLVTGETGVGSEGAVNRSCSVSDLPEPNPVTVAMGV